MTVSIPNATSAVAAPPHAAGTRVHWHPKRTWVAGPDGRIHAPEGYRVHVEPMRRYRHDRLCDEITCERCVHDCDCMDCSGWCQCDTPPEKAVFASRASIAAARGVNELIDVELSPMAKESC